MEGGGSGRVLEIDGDFALSSVTRRTVVEDEEAKEGGGGGGWTDGWMFSSLL
jgi:hypothetical protein